MEYTNEVKKMTKVTCGASHGCAPIPQEGKWTYSREIKDINVLSSPIDDIIYKLYEDFKI